MSRIIDISETLAPGMTVWPGDTEFQTFWVSRIDRGDMCNVGSITMSLHTGTHIDAPQHVLAEGGSPADASLTPYIGIARVIDASGTRCIEPQHVPPLAADRPERLLFKTGTDTADRSGRPFSYFSPPAARALVALGVRLVGIDTPSVDPADSKTLESHKIFAEAGVAILENLQLTDVTPGRYELIALPLKLAGMDASPVRAVLRTIH